MKVILNGATAGTNFGDFLFAQMFQNSVGDIVRKENGYAETLTYICIPWFVRGKG